MSQPQIEYYQLRDFGQKFNATIEFIRWNFKSLATITLVITLPAIVIMGFLLSNLMQSFFDLGLSDPDPGDEFFLAFFGALGVNYILLIIVVTIASAFVVAAVYTYMRLLPETEGTPELGDVLRQSFKKVPGLILLFILIGIITVLGFLFFIIPGIYLMIVFLISVPVYMFEDVSVGDAISRPFKLIKGKWWSTLGLIFIATITAQFAAYIFIIPSYAIMFSEIFRLEDNPNQSPEELFEMFTSWGMVVSLAFAALGSYLTRLIPTIAMSFQYFNLVERTEGTGLKTEIEDFESID